MRRAIGMAMVVLLGAGCQMRPSGEAGACAADRFAGLVGQPAADLGTRGLPEGTRLIWPDTAVTQDFRADRLNVLVGRDGRVAQVACY